MIDLDEIERLAREATPGEWSVRETVINGIRYGGHWVETDHEDLIQITGSGGARSFAHRVFDRQIHDDNEANAAFVVGVQPATVLALVARLRAAEAALGLLIEELDDPCRRMPVCNWDAFSHAWVQDKTTHSVHLSLALEKQARAAYRALTEESNV